MPWTLAHVVTRLPGVLASTVIGREPVVVEGQTLDRQVQLVLWARSRDKAPPLSAGSVEAARARHRVAAPLLAPRVPLFDRAELTVAGASGPLRARAYAPHGSGATALPGLVLFPGGGWVLGELDAWEPVAAALALAAGCRVVLVEVRRAPEHPFPAPVDDAWAAFKDVATRAGSLAIDPARIAVGGDGSGANLAAVVGLLARAAPPRPALQVLVCPHVDASSEPASMNTFALGYSLTRDDVRWFRTQYLRRPDDSRDVRASPLLAPDLRGVAPAVVLTCGFDPLRDEGRAYAQRLRAAGVRVDERREDALVHGFLHVAGDVDAARAALEGLGASIRAGLAPA